MPPHPLTNFEIQKYYKNVPRFNGVFSRNNLFKKNKRWSLYNKYIINIYIYIYIYIYIINLDEYVYFDSFGIERIPEEVK